eukprot:scaffold252323_cov18-Tisochrysis_lutea.AAC.1
MSAFACTAWGIFPVLVIPSSRAREHPTSHALRSPTSLISGTGKPFIAHCWHWRAPHWHWSMLGEVGHVERHWNT